MPNKIRFPSKDGDFNTFILALFALFSIPANKIRFLINAAKFTEFSDNIDLWTPNWIAINKPAQRTTVLVKLKTKLKGVLKTNANTIIGDIPDTILTEDDREAMRIFARIAGSRIPVVAYAVVLALDSVAHLWAKLILTNIGNPSTKRFPKGNYVFLETYIGLPNLALTDIPFANGKVVTTHFYTLTFVKEDVGKTCYVRAFFQNSKGDRSPESLFLIFAIT